MTKQTTTIAAGVAVMEHRNCDTGPKNKYACAHGLVCHSNLRKNTIRMVSNAGFGIKGLGPKTITVLIELGLIKTPLDVFRLTTDSIVESTALPYTTAEFLINSIEQSKRIKLGNFIYSLCIASIGSAASKRLASLGTLYNVLTAPTEALTTLPTVNIHNVVQLRTGLDSNAVMMEGMFNLGVVVTGGPDAK